jgi:hypothetical protein
MNVLKRIGYVTMVALLIMVSCQSDEEVTKTIAKAPETSLITDITAELADDDGTVIKRRSNPSAALLSEFFPVWMTVTKTACDRYTIEVSVDEVRGSSTPNGITYVVYEARLLNFDGSVAISYHESTFPSGQVLKGRLLRKGISYNSYASTNLKMQVRFREQGFGASLSTTWITAVDVSNGKNFFTVRKTC